MARPTMRTGHLAWEDENIICSCIGEYRGDNGTDSTDTVVELSGTRAADTGT